MRIEFYLKQRIQQNLILEVVSWRSLSRTRVVKVHLWTAIISYMTVARIKADYNSCYSITEVATLIRISALERVELRQFITKQDPSTNSNQNVKELSLFDDF